MSDIGRRSAKSRNLTGEPRSIPQDELAVGRAIGAVIERDVHLRLRLEDKCSTLNKRAPAADHRINDLQYAAVARFQHTVVRDGCTSVEDKCAASNIGVDGTVRFVDQG